ncbi:hypothetical protein [uncultured Propionivibrio sp.]|uniref:hypothetical protein n=1 Tax=uncultured Propionivibrio sp. TaxID=426737 RepID=UPI0029C0305A|nr:hypothetical protein [uncultured Propionivibrio sp.]
MLAWLRKRWRARRTSSDIAAAMQLIQAIDRGGIPLNPAKVNAIARELGLEVSRRDPVEKTILRIRLYLQRV